MKEMAQPPKRRVLRWATRLAALLLIGAVINVGVAWRFAAISQRAVDSVPWYADMWGPEQLAADARWPVRVPDNWPPPQMYSALRHYIGNDSYDWNYLWANAHRGEELWDATKPLAHRVHSTICGWPARSMRLWEISETWIGDAAPERSWERRVGEIELPPSCLRVVSYLKGSEVLTWRIPTIPIWTGFAINTLFYAACIGTAWVGFIGAKRTLITGRRRRRNLCPACAYQLTGEPICPECGAAAKIPHPR